MASASFSEKIIRRQKEEKRLRYPNERISSSSSNDGGSKEAKILKKVREIIIKPFFHTNVLNKVLHPSFDLFFQRKKRKVDVDKIKSRNQQNNNILKKHEEFMRKTEHDSTLYP